MERRALLAFLLSLAILVLWEAFLQPPPPPEKPDVAQQSETAPQKPSETTPSGEPSQAPPPSKETESTLTEPLKSLPPDQMAQAPVVAMEEQYETWEMETPLYKAKFIAPGGRMSLFELKEYHQESGPDSPLTELVSTRSSGYLPLAMDFLHNSEWNLSTRPFVSGNPSKVSLSPDESSQILTLWTEEPGQFRVTKEATFNTQNYTIDVEIRVKNLGPEPLVDQLGLSFYFEPFDGVDKETQYNQSQLSFFKGGGLEYLSTDDIVEKKPVLESPLNWVGYQNNYFIQAVVPAEDQSYQIVPRILDESDGLMQMAYLTDAFRLETGEEKSFRMTLYWGPKELDKLREVEHRLGQAVDFGWFSFLAKPFVHVLKWLYGYTHNYGVAIIILTVIIKIIFWPLTHKSYKSMQAMKKLQPKMMEIREKYKDDREKLNSELMMLYKTYKVNPLGGCLPMVLQIPVFLAFYRMLYSSVELLHEPFFLWIDDLTAPDRLPVGFEIPFLGGLPVLTILMGASMFIQQKMTPTPGDPRQEKIMLMMPLIFIVFFVNFPSGLVLYWLVNNVLSIVQQSWINRRV